jgi:diguanylate cyclase (GGDEF)-like protein/PAS domain S-box-containing protein
MQTGKQWLTKKWHDFAAWHMAGGISMRITLSTLALTMFMVAGCGLISLGALYWMLEQNVSTELDSDSRIVQQRLDNDLNRIAIDLSKLAESSFIVDSLLAPTGNKQFLSQKKFKLSHPMTLALYDNQVRLLGLDPREASNILLDAGEIGRAIEANQSRARILSDPQGKHWLHLLYPVSAPSSGRVEGVLLAVLDMDQIFQLNTQQLEPKFQRAYVAVGFPTDTHRTWRQESGTVSRTFRARLQAPLDELDLQIRIGQARMEAFALLQRMLIAYGIFGLLVLFLAQRIARHIGQRLAWPISNLSRTASEIATSGSFNIKAEAHGQDEVAILARTFNNMLDRLRTSHARLAARESEFKALVENSPDLIARFDRQFRCVYVNHVVHSYFGVNADQVLGHTGHELGIGKDMLPAMARLLKEGGESMHEYDTAGRYFEVRFVSEYGIDGMVASLLAIIREDTARRLAEEGLRLANRAIASSVNPILIASCLEPDYPIKYVNPAFLRVTGYTEEEVLGRNCRFLQGDDCDQPELEQLRDALHERREIRLMLRNYRKDGTRFWNELYIAPVTDADGTVTHFVGEINDVTASRAHEEKLHHQATHDALTGLPNRSLLTDRLMQAISYAQRYQRLLVVAFIDLDKFKSINDSLGHDVGDQLLIQVAERLNKCVRDSDTVARLGGDEFVLVLYDQASEDATYHAMQRVLASISAPMMLAGRELTITCSIGFAIYPQDGRDAETLLKKADTAMYRAKEMGRDNFQFYTSELHARINERLALEAGLRLAFDRNEFVLHYQPCIDLSTGKVSSVEVLIRWQHPELGLMLPLRFIPLAEEIGLVHQIGDWVMRSACLQHQAWRKGSVADVPVAVNVSAPQFLQKGFAGSVAAVLRDTGIDPSRLELDITEGLSMQDPETTIRVFHELKALGIKLSIDDFGTGYSNLSYLKRFPIDKIKLDQSFVRDIVRNHEDLAISDAVISMAHSLHLKLIAEGVESEAQLALLVAHGCDEMQGYYFSLPVPAAECTVLLQEECTLPLENIGRRRAISDIDRA